ncbi:MAG: hypothetical protein HY886_10860 [Deltaproteobacteria bacterium]|nr:hypothetical protein [Deltaproteobacteria bacterium]
MTLVGELKKSKAVFIDTAPIIYHIEAHPRFGPIVKEAAHFFKLGNL